MRHTILNAAFAVAAAVAFAGSALAFETKPYDAAAFKADQAAGKPVVVHVHADWCPTCKSQQQAFKSMESDPALKDVTVYTVDFDNDAAAVKAFKARSQSTLVAFKGAKETGRSAGDTKKASIEALLKSTVE